MIQLLPENFSDSVLYFNDFFKLKIQRPDLNALKKILEKFATIPYENISKIINLSNNWNNDKKIRLPDIVIDGHTKFHLGGTCFSLTFFLETILLHHGYQNYPVMADMRAGKNIHCALITILDNEQYLVDPGYLLNEPMEMNPLKPRFYRTSSIGVELKFNETTGEYELFTFNKDNMKWRYNFKNVICPKDEFFRHWQASFTRSSMHGVCLTKNEKEAMIYIHKNFMRETTFTSKKNYNIKNSYAKTIKNIFGIDENLTEQAQEALNMNLDMEKKLGIFVPKEK
jgi:arylamine N-acetyltransferase